jgi:MFS family permease
VSGRQPIATSTKPPADRRLAAFQYPNYRLYWAGQLATNVGSWMQIVATGWLVLELTDSPAYLGLNGVFLAAPILVLSLVGGVLADRVDRYRLMIWSQVAQLIPDVVLAVLVGTGTVQVWQVLAYSLIGSIIRGLTTPARQAFVPSLVPRSALLSAIALNSILWQGAAVLGPSAAGLILAAWGTPGNFYVNAGSDVVSLVLLLLVRVPALPPRVSTRSPWQGLASGARYIWEQPSVRALLLASAGISLLGRSYTQLMPLFARDVLDVGPTGLGLLLTMPGLGTILAALGLASAGAVPQKGGWFLAASSVLAIALAIFAASTHFLLSLGVLVLVGLAATVSTTLANTLLQEEVADRMRGRVMGFYMAATQGMSPLGALPGGLLAEVFGGPFAIGLGAGCLLLLMLVLSLRTDALRRLN